VLEQQPISFRCDAQAGEHRGNVSVDDFGVGRVAVLCDSGSATPWVLLDIGYDARVFVSR